MQNTYAFCLCSFVVIYFFNFSFFSLWYLHFHYILPFFLSSFLSSFLFLFVVEIFQVEGRNQKGIMWFLVITTFHYQVSVLEFSFQNSLSSTTSTPRPAAFFLLTYHHINVTLKWILRGVRTQQNHFLPIHSSILFLTSKKKKIDADCLQFVIFYNFFNLIFIGPDFKLALLLVIKGLLILTSVTSWCVLPL